MKNQLSHERFGALLLKINEQKEAITNDPQSGKVDLNGLMQRHGVAKTAMTSALNALDIPFGHKLSALKRNGILKPVEKDLLIVVKRLCEQLNVPSLELDKHL